VILERAFNARYWGRSVSFQAVRRWLKGEAIPSQEKLQVLAEWLKLEPHVLRFGDSVAKAVRASRKRWDEGLGYLERETFDAFLALPASQRKALREIIMSLAEVPATGAPPVAKKRVKET
jgi:transcriptional regulator with XRE-family HTH domain